MSSSQGLIDEEEEKEWEDCEEEEDLTFFDFSFTLPICFGTSTRAWMTGFHHPICLPTTNKGKPLSFVRFLSLSNLGLGSVLGLEHKTVDLLGSKS